MEKIVEYINGLFQRRFTRKSFLRTCGALLALASFSRAFRHSPQSALAAQFNGRSKKGRRGTHDLVDVKGEDPYQITRRAVEEMGGMSRFVGKGDTVVVKPNIGWDRAPEQAGNTNPAVVGALIDMCYEAGAKRVKVFDITCNDQRRCYDTSGIEAVARSKKAMVFYPDSWNTVKARFDYASDMEGWPILRDAIECDTFINVPVAKHHGLTRLTLSMKNLMGVCSGSRGVIHQNIGANLVDLTDFINPDLHVVDAYRVLVRNGPTGGSLDDVVKLGRVIVSTDATLIDTHTAGLMEVDPLAVPYIRHARERGFGIADPSKADIVRVEV